jgi:hypothetical protein
MVEIRKVITTRELILSELALQRRGRLCVRLARP